MTEKDVLKCCQELEDNELLARGSSLTALNYAELILFYLVQQRLIEAKFCYLRAFDKFKDEILTEINTISSELLNGNFGKALKKCRSLKLDPELQIYLNELINRLVAIQLKLVGRCYVSIEKKNLANLLGFEDETNDEIIANEANDIFNDLLDESKSGWTCDKNNAYILPNDSPKFHSTINNLINIELFGPIHNESSNIKLDSDVGVESLLLNDNSIEALKSLIKCNDFLDSN